MSPLGPTTPVVPSEPGGPRGPVRPVFPVSPEKSTFYEDNYYQKYLAIKFSFFKYFAPYNSIVVSVKMLFKLT